MCRYSAYSFILVALAATTRALPVDDVLARNGIGSAYSGVGGQASGGSVGTGANDCTGTDCALAGLLHPQLIKVGSGNAGNGGSAPSGSASGSSSLNSIGGTDTTGKIPVGSGFSGAGGQALGGSVDSSPALAELDSDNGGDGGNASSGNSVGSVL